MPSPTDVGRRTVGRGAEVRDDPLGGADHAVRAGLGRLPDLLQHATVVVHEHAERLRRPDVEADRPAVAALTGPTLPS